MTGRRGFLRVATLAAAGGVLPPAIARALALPAARRSGTLEDVEHVVILMQENRSFDHYFGALPGVRGFGDRFTVPQAGGRSVWQQHNGRRVVLPWALDGARGNAQPALDLPHTWPDAHAAWDEGRLRQWPRAKTDASMAYYPPHAIPAQVALADAFTLCDAYHCSLHGGTNPNRLFLFTGTNDPRGLAGGPAIDNRVDGLGPPDEGFGWTTYAERLEAAGVRWTVYQDMADNYGDNPLVTFRRYRQAYLGDRASPLMKGLGSTLQGASLDGLRRDVVAGRLPQVSWVVAPREYCEHPGPSTPVQGGWYTLQVLDALLADEEVWRRTVLLVMYDENDGFFDHVPPPAPPSPRPDGSLAGHSMVDDGLDRIAGQVVGLGPRVPLWAISPWSTGGWVNSQVFDHTSVLRFLERRFGVAEPNISPWRRAVCGDLTSCFDFRRGAPRPVAPPVRERAWADATRARERMKPGIEVPEARTQRLPVQPPGTRPSRALPYRLDVVGRVEQGGLALAFVNDSPVATVFHVVDRLRVGDVPRRYTVAAGERWSDRWAGQGDDAAYDVWLLGPNGFHRLWCGRASTDAAIDVRARFEGGELVIELDNGGAATIDVEIAWRAYAREAPVRVTFAPAATHAWRGDCARFGGWYDVELRCGAWMRRLAGRHETGEDSTSDPAFGVHAR